MNNGTGQTTHRGRLIAVFLTVFIDLLGFGIVIPLLPIYSKAYGASEMELGLLFASFSGMQLIFSPFWGRLSDRFGRRPILIGGLVGTAGSYLIFAAADSMPLLYLSRILAGFFGANVATAQAYIADVTTDQDRSKGMGLIGAAFGLGFTFGPLLGGELVGVNIAGPGLAAAALSAIAAVVGWFKLSEPENPARDHSSRIFGFETLGFAMRHARIGTILLLYFLAVVSFAGFEAMFIRFGLAKFPETFHVTGSIEEATMDQVMAAAPIAGRYLFFIGLMAAVVQGGLIRRLVPRFGETRLIVAGPFLLGLAMAAIGLATTWTHVIIACVIMPLGFGINNPSLNGLLSRAVPPERQGAFLGLNQSLGSLARVVGPMVAAGVFQSGGPSAPFLLSAAVLLGATVIAAGYDRRFRASFLPPSTE